jgi:hypothetical protein
MTLAFPKYLGQVRNRLMLKNSNSKKQKEKLFKVNSKIDGFFWGHPNVQASTWNQS